MRTSSSICAHCSQPFVSTPKARKQKFCSPACRHKNWSSNNRAQLNDTVRKYRKRRYEREGSWRDEGDKAKALKAWMLELKSNPCADCGGTFDSCCMDFDHREGTDKQYNIASMFAHHYSRELIEVELAKCELVCANCHRIRTRDRRIGSGGKRNELRCVPEDRTA